MRVFLTGGTGLLGRRLIPELQRDGHAVDVLTRNPKRAKGLGDKVNLVEGDPGFAGPWLDRVRSADAVVHLAGENLFARRWTDAFLKEARDSRVDSTRLIAETLAERPTRDGGGRRVFVNGSAVGYYGSRGDEDLTEEASPGENVLADICVEWEKATGPAREAGLRVAILRTGIVLDGRGGALPKMARPFRFFVGGRIGTGKQWVSWVHHRDLTGLIRLSLNDSRAEGAINAVAPAAVRNVELCRAIGRVLRRPSWLPAPRWALRVALGRVVQVICEGQRVVPAAAERLGYEFQYRDLEAALRDALDRN